MTRRCGQAAMVLLSVAVGACAALGPDGPYVSPRPIYGEPPTRSFFVRFSAWRHDQEAVRRTIRDQCGPGVLTARVTERPYRGTLLHPQQLAVTCGAAPPPEALIPGQRVDPGYLIRLDDAAPVR